VTDQHDREVELSKARMKAVPPFRNFWTTPFARIVPRFEWCVQFLVFGSFLPPTKGKETNRSAHLLIIRAHSLFGSCAKLRNNTHSHTHISIAAIIHRQNVRTINESDIEFLC
jgi:hypothetical protein